MVSKMKSTSEKEQKNRRVKVKNLKAMKELSADDARKVKGGRKAGGEDPNKYLKVTMEDVLINR